MRMQNVYNNGGKKFLIYNTGPLGCLPQKLALQQQIYSELDAYGCLAVHNNASKAFNTGLSVLVDQLNSQYTNATFVYVDIFRIKYDLIANHTKYGEFLALIIIYDRNVNGGRLVDHLY